MRGKFNGSRHGRRGRQRERDRERYVSPDFLSNFRGEKTRKKESYTTRMRSLIRLMKIDSLLNYHVRAKSHRYFIRDVTLIERRRKTGDVLIKKREKRTSIPGDAFALGKAGPCPEGKWVCPVTPVRWIYRRQFRSESEQ